MQDRRKASRMRALRAGKILFNDRRSAIDCVVRNQSEDGASLQVASVAGIPVAFDLKIDGESTVRPCAAIWSAQNRIGVEFARAHEDAVDILPDSAMHALHATHPAPDAHASPEQMRSEMLALRAALTDVPFGIVLLDAEMRAQFINRTFRRMSRLPDSKADSKPAFVSLMYHGRDTRAYDISENELQAYVAERVALVKVGDQTPMDLRLSNGEVLRFQCTPLPNGGRMLCYTYVTDIVHRSDELEALRTALDSVQQGITLLDANLNVQFMNRAVRRMWQLSDEYVARQPHYTEVMATARANKPVEIPPDELEAYIPDRIAAARRGDLTPKDIRTTDGRVIRSQCAVLPNGGRMLTYTDVSDLVLAE